jgi:hypothetical protein
MNQSVLNLNVKNWESEGLSWIQGQFDCVNKFLAILKLWYLDQSHEMLIELVL